MNHSEYRVNITGNVNTNLNSHTMEYECVGCGKILTDEEVIWATKDGKLTINGNPYCDSCIPEYKG